MVCVGVTAGVLEVGSGVCFGRKYTSCPHCGAVSESIDCIPAGWNPNGVFQLNLMGIQSVGPDYSQSKANH